MALPIQRAVAGGGGRSRVASLAMASLIMCSVAVTVQAQSVVVTACSDRSRSAMGKRVNAGLRKALGRRGVKVVGYKRYLQAARRVGLDRRARTPTSIRKLSKAMNLAGVVTCAVQRRKGRFLFSAYLYGPDGTVRLQKTFPNKKPRLSSKVIGALAAAVVDKLSVSDPGDAIALVPLVPPQAETQAAPKGPDQRGEDASRKRVAPGPSLGTASRGQQGAKERAANRPVAELQAGGRQPEVSAEARDRFHPPDRVDDQDDSPPTAVATAVQRPPEPVDREPTAAVADLWLVAGASMHTRAGLSPRYAAKPFFGMRFEGRMFLGSLVDAPVLSDIGFGGMYDRGFGLKYSAELRPETLPAHEQHWRAELIYRLSFAEWRLGPALLFRLGYGSSANTIDSEYADVLSAEYTYTFGALEAHLWLIRSLLGLSLSTGYLFDVWPSGRLAGNGSGFLLGLGVCVELFDTVHLSVGYEQLQFVFDERQLGETSDRYQGLFLRFGWSHRRL